MNYTNRTVIITGAAKGMGAATAEIFYNKGANVALLDLSESESNKQDERWFYQQCNVADD